MSRLLTLISLIFMINLYKVLSDCGTPGNSKISEVTESDIKEYYKNGDTVKYHCKYADAALIIGPIERKCVNDRWTGPIPKCGSRIMGVERGEYVYDYTVHPWFKNPIKIAGITVRISSATKASRDHLTNLTDSYCTVVTGENPPKKVEHQFPIWTEFTCVKTHVDVNEYPLQTSLAISFDKRLKSNCDPTKGCDNSNEAYMDRYDVYSINSDDCDIPDAPSNGKVKKVANDTQTKFIIKCKNQYESMGNLSYAYCPLNGDWEYKKFPKCSKMGNNELIIGLSIGIIGIIIIALFIVIYIRKKKKRNFIKFSQNLKTQNEYNLAQKASDDIYDDPVYYEQIPDNVYADINEDVNDDSQYAPINCGLNKNGETPQTPLYLDINPNNSIKMIH